MAIEFPIADAALPFNLDVFVKLALVADEPLVLRLFKNDLLPSRGTTLANYVEATFGGYAERTLNRADFGDAYIEDDHVARIKLAGGPQVYHPTTSGEVLYGVYLVRVSLGQVAFAKRFSVPRTVVAAQSFSVNPVITMRSDQYEV